jgi:hypothetical protein
MVPLPPSGRQAGLSFAAPPRRTALQDLPVRFEVQVTNRSDRTWPAFASVGPHLVRLGYRWLAGDGTTVMEQSAADRLPYDLAPGESLRALLNVRAPGRTGVHRLLIAVTQDGEWFPHELGPILVNVLSFDQLGQAQGAPR